MGNSFEADLEVFSCCREGRDRRPMRSGMRGRRAYLFALRDPTLHNLWCELVNCLLTALGPLRAFGNDADVGAKESVLLLLGGRRLGRRYVEVPHINNNGFLLLLCHGCGLARDVSVCAGKIGRLVKSESPVPARVRILSNCERGQRGEGMIQVRSVHQAERLAMPGPHRGG